MSKLNNETYIDYRDRLMNPISSTFCAAKWYNATIWLGHGQSTSCHHPPSHAIKKSHLIDNPSAIHNTQHKKAMRKMMLDGKRPSECEYCWKIEDIGRNNVSDRYYKTAVFNDVDINKIKDIGWDEDVNLRTLEVSFDRVCNFACSYCSPSFSTKWVSDISKNGPYKNIISDGRGHYDNTADHVKGYENSETNPYIIAFWKWWDSGLSDNLEEIRVTGGEPLLSKGTWQLFEWFKKNPGLKMRYAVNSNLCPTDDKLIDKLIDNASHVENFEIYTSCESVGKQAEYIRDGMDYNKWKHNLHKILKSGHVKRIHIMMTINSLCLSSLTEFMEEMKNEFKDVYGEDSVIFSVNILRFPSFQSPAILPVSLKHKYRDKLNNWLILNKNNRLIRPHEQEQIQRLVDYLDVVYTPHKNTAEEYKLYNDFKSYYYQYDKRRGKDFSSVFSEDFVDFYNSVEVDLSEDALNKDVQLIRSTSPQTLEEY